MTNYSSMLFSKSTDSPLRGGAVTLYTDTKTLTADNRPKQIFHYVPANDDYGLMFEDVRTGALIEFVVTAREYYDRTNKLDIKRYLLSPTEDSKTIFPSYANTKMEISVVEE